MRQVEENRTQRIQDLARGIRSDCSVPSGVRDLVGCLVQEFKLDPDRDNGAFVQDVVLVCQRREDGYVRVLICPDSRECVRERRLICEEVIIDEKVAGLAIGLYSIRAGTESVQSNKLGWI